MERKTVMVRVYLDDREVLKRSNSRSIAQAVHTLLYGSKEDMKELVGFFMEREVMPYVQKRMAEIESKALNN